MLRSLVPAPVRARLREAWSDLPVRLGDLPADLGDAFGRSGPPLPPARFRRRVARSSSRREFLAIGRRCADDLLALALSLPADGARTRWLDFGCGCGRIGRHLAGRTDVDLTGVDVDRAPVSWAAAHLPGRFLPIPPRPPLPFPGGAFDVAFSVSVFTHLDEAKQLEWLAELRRVLRSGGLLLASTHGPALAATLPSGWAVRPEEVVARGFVHLPSDRGFNHQASFHSPEYLEARWSRFFRPLAFRAAGLAGYQDLSAWVKM